MSAPARDVYGSPSGTTASLGRCGAAPPQNDAAGRSRPGASSGTGGTKPKEPDYGKALCPIAMSPKDVATR